MNQKREAISDQLRRAILSADITRYRISKELGIHQATLTRFVHGERGLTLEVIDALGQLLGLRLVVDGAPERPAAGGPDAAKPEPAKPEPAKPEAATARRVRRSVPKAGGKAPSKKGGK